MRRRRQRKPADSLLRLASRADLLDDPQVQKLVTAAALTNNTPLTRQIKQMLTVKAIQHQRQPFNEQLHHIPSFRDRLALGTTITGSTYEIEQDTVAQHVLAVGQSGVGKTTLFYNLMDQLTVPFWVFDLKQDYRHLMQHDDELVVLPWAELKLNPLQPPPGVPPRRWAQVFSEIFGYATALLSGSKNYLMKQLIELYQRYDLFDAVEPPYPSLHDLQQLLDEHEINYVRKTANYRDTVVNRLEAMNLTADTIFDCSKGYPLETLLERNVVFEFDGPNWTSWKHWVNTHPPTGNTGGHDHKPMTRDRWVSTAKLVVRRKRSIGPAGRAARDDVPESSTVFFFFSRDIAKSTSQRTVF